MATAESVQLSEPHAPKDASIKAFESVLSELKRELIHLRADHDKHEKEYFSAVRSLSDTQLTSFTAHDLESVRVGSSAYGLHLFCQVRIPGDSSSSDSSSSSPGYIHVRLFIAAEEGTDGATAEDRVAKLHSIHTEEREGEGGDRVFRAVFGKEDGLEWFDT